MRVTFVLPYAGLAGGTRIIANHARQLMCKGHQVFAVSTPPRRPSLRQRFRSVIKGGGWLRAQPPGPSHFDGLGVPHRVLDRVRPIADADVPDADVVIATWWETAEGVARLSSTKGAKVAFFQGYELSRWHDNAELKRAWRLPLHKIVVSQWLLTVAREQFGESHVSVVPNAVDTAHFCAPPRTKQRCPTIGVLYQPAYCKGVDICLEAFRRAKAVIPTLRLVAFGAAPPTSKMPLPAQTEFFHQPAQSAIPGIYASCDAWLFGSRFEGFGLPVLEAMACGTPVIATPAGAAPELVSGGGGVLVEAEDPDDMMSAIMSICAMDPQQWGRMSIAARATACSYTWDDATRLFESALETAVERQKRTEVSRAATA